MTKGSFLPLRCVRIDLELYSTSVLVLDLLVLGVGSVASYKFVH